MALTEQGVAMLSSVLNSKRKRIGFKKPENNPAAGPAGDLFCQPKERAGN